MIFLLVSFFFSCIIYFIFLLIMFFLSDSIYFNKEKLLSFECGMESKSLVRVPFSMQFFFISIIFILFDMEIIFLIHLFFYLNMMNLKFYLIFLVLFFIFLFLTLLVEWKWNSFNWIF